MFLQAKDNGFRLALTDELRARVAKGNPTEIHLGIRPIHITVRSASAGAANDLAIAGQVYTYEDLGEEGQLAAHVGEQMVLVNTAPGLDFVRGDNVSLHFLANRMHLFDAKSELAL
ncbi:MAG: TOBE domain-containing protein [Anaerolineae bacterium]